MPPFRPSRRDALMLASASGLSAMPAPCPGGGASAQTAGTERVLRYGISMADIPQTTGQPDRGAGAYRFTGHTLCNPLVAWDMDVADRLGKPRPPPARRSRTPSSAASTRKR